MAGKKVLGPWWVYVGEQVCGECEQLRPHCWTTGSGWMACQRHFITDQVEDALIEIQKQGALCPAP